MQEPFAFLIAQEPVFKDIYDQYGLPTIPQRPEGFETLVLLILEQQVSIDSAKATFLKLKTIGTGIHPEILLDLCETQFRAAGVSRQKTSYIKALASAILSKELLLEALATAPPYEVRETLLKIKGIGHWTIDIYLMFALKAPDVFPLGDIAVVNTLKELFNVHEKSEMEMLSQSWSPYRSYATYLLWHHYLGKRKRTINYNP
ncbi:DNA-3-methyladenine glycosylase II [Flavobacterium succinicans]|uniref:DNA-3-methyladenine glycosylase II n=1 Tax=Flavobacterium succinicans TaxID=29536 RepID=A0A1I4VTK8_9FLAO|nr:DNA-3-methyladenine glycosylase [Flavobacterium succinicans]SFN04638.1 DNA-3-methyladenine glycosylase II [Flavobacterium succinicans]